jgi:ribosome maturation factor RimP
VGSWAHLFISCGFQATVPTIRTDEQRQGYIDSLIDTLWVLGKKACDLFGLDLIEVEVNRGRGRLLVRLYIDRHGDGREDQAPGEGVTVDDCAHVSRAVEKLLDAEDPIEGAYTLEVSSPGLDRPVRRPEDFTRFQGSEIRIKTEVPIDDRTHVTGTLVGISDGSVIVRGEDDREFRIPLGAVKKARLVNRRIP